MNQNKPSSVFTHADKLLENEIRPGKKQNENKTRTIFSEFSIVFNTNWQRAHVWKRKNARRHATNVMPFSETRSTGTIEVEGEDMSCYTHQTLFQQQLYNPDLKPLLYMPALSEVGFHRSHYLFSTNSCQTLLSNVPPVNQSIAATHRNQDKVPLVITAKSKFNYLHINPGQTASKHGRQGVW